MVGDETGARRPRGLVLAGGAGSRLGGPKADLRAGDTSWARRAAGVLAPLCVDVRIGVRPGQIVDAPGFEPVDDPLPGGQGPLPAVAAALGESPAGLLVLACDYPAIETEFFRAILASRGPGDGVRMALDGRGRRHPLAAAWFPAALPELQRALARGERSVRRALAGVRVGLGAPGDFPGLDLDAQLHNVNRPEDLDAWRRYAGRR